MQIEYVFGLGVLCVPVEGEKAVNGYEAACEQQISQLTALLWVRGAAELCTSQSFMYTQTSAPGCRHEKHLLFLFSAIEWFNNPSAGWKLGILWEMFFWKCINSSFAKKMNSVDGLQI